MKKVLLCGIAAVLFAACGEGNKNNQSGTEIQPEIKTVSSTPVVHKPMATTAEFKDSLVGMAYEDYNQMKSALVNSDAEKVQKTATDFMKTLDRMESVVEMKDAVKGMSETDNLEKQREVFQVVTANMTELVAGNLTSGKLYYQFCPMAFGGKGGFWLSNSEKIMNPYYGESMLRCGEVRKVIQ